MFNRKLGKESKVGGRYEEMKGKLTQFIASNNYGLIAGVFASIVYIIGNGSIIFSLMIFTDIIFSLIHFTLIGNVFNMILVLLWHAAEFVVFYMPLLIFLVLKYILLLLKSDFILDPIFANWFFCVAAFWWSVIYMGLLVLDYFRWPRRTNKIHKTRKQKICGFAVIFIGIFVVSNINIDLLPCALIGCELNVEEESITPKYNITIKGNNQFIKKTQDSLNFLEKNHPITYRIVEENIGVIKETSSRKSYMKVHTKPPVCELSSRISSTKERASTIAHEACHSKLYHDYLREHPDKDNVPYYVYGGTWGEMKCLRYGCRIDNGPECTQYFIKTGWWLIPF